MRVAEALKKKKCSDEARDRDRDGEDVGDLKKCKAESRKRRSSRGGKTRNILKAHDEENTDESAYAQKKRLKVAAQ